MVAEDPRSGALLALASHPSFDPNDFAFTRNAEIAAYNADTTSPLLMRATSGTVPSGSTFKPITAAAALKAGVVKPDERVPCPTCLDLDTAPRARRTTSRPTSGPIDLSTAIARSCNTASTSSGNAYEKSPALLPDMARSFGLGEADRPSVRTEEPGGVPSFSTGGEATNLAIEPRGAWR